MNKSNVSIISIPGYHITELINLSARTSIYRGEQIKTNKSVIIKTLNTQYPQLRDLIAFKNQFTITQNLDHPYIIKCYKLESYNNSYALILEDMGGISLNTYTQSQPLHLKDFFTIAIDIIQAVEFIHQNQIIHKDIKTKNILINPETKTIKLIDFSISCLLPKEIAEIKNPNVLEGTLAYMSPEQTGRMNRGIDYRTDFYSLGVTFYELLTGTLPFISESPLELVHCHIAKTPQSPQEINPKIPEHLANLILKLMAKIPEERYQTAQGIRYDLEQCQQILLTPVNTPKFELGKRDKTDKFIISEKIYGRENEISTLLQSFDRVSNGNKELMLVTGVSGIGKTAVIQEIHKPIVSKKGYFISGKYDQFQRNIPLAAILNALHNLLQQLLTESNENLQEWKKKILSVLGEQGQVIIDVIPELEKIIGKQPPVTELINNAAQNRFNLLFKKFVQIFASKEHPLVIFLDDLQWADTASLKFIELLISESETKYIFFIGAYRDNEVTQQHPLLRTLNNIQQQKITINIVNLKPLNITQLNLLIADNLLCPESEAIPLTELLLSKTNGNPFFANQLMKSMYENGLISFNVSLGYWKCDIYAVQALYQNNDIVKFLETQIIKLPINTQNTLKIAACLGNQFDLYTLSIVCDKSQVEVSSYLWNALQKELIIPQDENYKIYADTLSTSDLDLSKFANLKIKYQFFHDRVQQAAYALIPENKKPETHLKIGKLLLKNAQFLEPEDQIFEIVNQINIGIDLIDQRAEKYKLAQLNLVAARQAKLSTAYEAANRYLKFALGILATDSWQTHYNLTLNIYTEAAEVEFLNIHFQEAETYINIVQKNAKNILDQVKVYELKIQIYMATVKINLAIETGLRIIKMLGVTLQTQPPTNLNVDDLSNLPVMTAPEKIAAMRILANLTAASYFVDPELFPAIIFTMINLSVKYGNCSSSAHGYVNYGVLLCGFFLDIDTGYRYGELALHLLDQFNAQDIKCRVLVMWNANINFWKNHISQTINSLSEAIRSGLENGDLEYAGYAAAMYNINMVLAGENLSYIQQELENYINLTYKFNQQGTNLLLRVWQQLVKKLSDSNSNIDISDFSSNSFDENAILLILINTKSSTILFSLYLAKIIFFYLFGDIQKSLANAIQGQEYLQYVVGQITVSQYNFYYSLVLLAEYKNQSTIEQKETINQVIENQEKIKNWANHVPENYQHKYDLVEAEKARVLGNNWQAMEFYDQAIAGAKKNKYIQAEALANELAALFYLDHGKNKIAQSYLITAYYCYVNWGAITKVKYLENKYPDLLAPVLKNQVIAEEAPVLISKIISDSRSHGVSAILDLETVTKASLAISSEIKIDRLINTLLQVMLENVGGEKALFFLKKEGELILVSQYIEGQKITLNSMEIDQIDNLPFSIINYVYNTQEPLLLHNACEENIFTTDPYIIQHQTKSILCNPILSQSQLIGIIYIENNLTTGVFTAERLKILQMLSSQAAISLENAQLYSKLEEKVANRTQELQEKNLDLESTLKELKLTQSQLIHTEKMSSLGQMVAGIAHEINNPVNFIYANVDYASNYIEALISLINLYQQEYPEPTSLIKKKIAEIDLNFLMADLPKILESMSVGSDRIRNLVLGLRNFSRHDEAEIKSVDIHQGIESTLMLLQPQIKQKLGLIQNIIIRNYGELPLITCYPSQLNQVFMNIISNSIDALHIHSQSLSSEEKEEYLTQIKISTNCINDHWIRISIQDNGMGIKPEIKNRIFDPFFTTKAVGSGTGLGLSISYQIIVEKHGGKIECISEMGMGTEFMIEIPVNLSEKLKTI